METVRGNRIAYLPAVLAGFVPKMAFSILSWVLCQFCHEQTHKEHFFFLTFISTFISLVQQSFIYIYSLHHDFLGVAAFFLICYFVKYLLSVSFDARPICVFYTT